MRLLLTAVSAVLVLQLAPTRALADPPSPTRPWIDAIERAERKLMDSEYARSSPDAARRTEEYLAGLIGAAWSRAGQALRLDTPAFSMAGPEVVGLPGLFNPDTVYSSALLDPAGCYRIGGRRGSHAQLTLQLTDAYPLVALGQHVQLIDPDALGIRPGDTFEIQLGGPKGGDHWQPLDPRARSILVRQTFSDWDETGTSLWIERLDEPAMQAPDARSRYAVAAEYLDRATALWVDEYLVRLLRLPVNVLPPPAPSESVGLAGQRSVMGRYAIDTESALLITVEASDALYQGIQVGDRWFVTPDYVRHQSSLNRGQAVADADGKLRFVVSLVDPGVPNWLDPDGSAEGFVFLRWQGLLGPPGTVLAERVPLTALRERLPAATPHVTPAMRREALRVRQRAPSLVR
jgi:hypothetical protein